MGKVIYLDSNQIAFVAPDDFAHLAEDVKKIENILHHELQSLISEIARQRRAWRTT